MTQHSDPKPQTQGRAPQIKSAPETVAAAFDDFMQGFEAFKEVNDRRLDEIERKLTADVITRDKVDRINKAMDDQKKTLDQLVLRRSRPPLGRAGELSLDAGEHKAAFCEYLRRGQVEGLRELEGKAYSGASGGEGGYLMPQGLDSEIGTTARIVSPMRAIATVRLISTASLRKPFSPLGLATGWVSETAARPETDTPAFAEIDVPTMELYAAPAATQTLLDDAAVDLEAWIASEVELAFAQQEGTAFITGDGTTRPKGLLAYPVINDKQWAWGQLGVVSTGTAGGFAASNPSDVLLDLVYALKTSYRQNARFMMNRQVQAEIRKIKDTTGNYIWQPPATADQVATLMGFAISEAEDMPIMGPNALAIAFGDFRAGYLIVDRTGIRVLRDPYTAKPHVIFYTTKRVGGAVQNFEAIKLLKLG